jgi:iron complex transport system permease protein
MTGGATNEASAGNSAAAVALCIAVTAVALTFALAVGGSALSLADLPSAIRALLDPANASPADQDARTIQLAIRFPRALVAALAGGMLGVAGVLSQGLFRNSLASPSVLGTEGGGSLAAVTALYLGTAFVHWTVLPLFAFLGALGATTLIHRLAGRLAGRADGAGYGVESLILVGLALNALFAAASSFVVSLAFEDHAKAGAVMHWLLGGFGTATIDHAYLLAPLVLVGGALALRLGPRLDVLSLGSEIASTLAVDVRSLRRQVAVAVAVLVGGAVAVAGALPFVGLIVPHATRGLVGPRHRPLMIASFANGATLTLVADAVARTVRAPAELEVGILTSLAGVPLFLWLLLRKRGAVA